MADWNFNSRKLYYVSRSASAPWLRRIPGAALRYILERVIILTSDALSVKQSLEKESTYEIKGKEFVVRSVFNDEGKETLGTVLLRLITANKTA